MDTNNTMNLFGAAEMISQSNLSSYTENSVEQVSDTDSSFSDKLQQAFSSLTSGDVEEAVDDLTSSGSDSDTESSTGYNIEVGYTDMALMATPAGRANLVRDMIQEQVTEQFKDLGKDIASAVVTGMMGELSVVAAVAENVAEATADESSDTASDDTTAEDDTAVLDAAADALTDTDSSSGGIWGALTSLLSRQAEDVESGSDSESEDSSAS